MTESHNRTEQSVVLETPWSELDKFVTSYIEDYEMRECEDANGNVGDYYPNENERMLITDAINGLLADDDFYKLAEASWQYTRQKRREEGTCEHCGCPPPDHYGLHCPGRSK